MGVGEKLFDYLPVPVVSKEEGDGGGGYYLDYGVPKTIGRLKGFVGNSALLLRAYTYIRLLGADGLDNVSSLAVLAANYLLKSLNAEAYTLAHGKGLRRKHEAVVSVKSREQRGALNVSKAILDYGMHSPTVYFPLIVDEALMIEPTETETVEDIDEYASLLNSIFNQMEEGKLDDPPKNTSVGRIDEVKASHPLTAKVKW